MTALRDRALVLRRFPYSESSLVVFVLTEHHGPLRLLARGAYRPKSRFFAVLDFFDELQLEWRTSRHSELATLVKGDLTRRRRGVTDELARYRAALSALELADLGSRPGQAQPETFRSLAAALDAWHAGSAPADEVRIWFELAFLRQHGIAPALIGCAACGKSAAPVAGRAPRAWFSAGAGGRLCEACANDARAAGRRVGTLPLDVLVVADKMSCDEAPLPHDLAPERCARVRDFVERFLDYHLETRPRSHRAFLARPNRNAPKTPSAAGD